MSEWSEPNEAAGFLKDLCLLSEVVHLQPASLASTENDNLSAYHLDWKKHNVFLR